MLSKIGKFFIILAIFCLTSLNMVYLPVYAEKSGIPVMVEDTTENLTIDNNLKVKDIDIDPINTDKVKKDVIPDTRQEGKKLMRMFIKTMLLVFASGCILYLILFFIKKFNRSSFVPTDEEYENSEMLDLLTPRTKNDALKSFLNRTK